MVHRSEASSSLSWSPIDLHWPKEYRPPNEFTHFTLLLRMKKAYIEPFSPHMLTHEVYTRLVFAKHSSSSVVVPGHFGRPEV